MKLQEFINNFAEQFDDLDVSGLTPETKFRDLDGWNSLVALSVIAMIDEEYDVTVTGDDIRKSTTIEDLFNAVKERM